MNMTPPGQQAEDTLLGMLDQINVDNQYKAEQEPGLGDNSLMFVPGAMFPKISVSGMSKFFRGIPKKGPSTTIDGLASEANSIVMDKAINTYGRYDPELAIQLGIRDLAKEKGRQYTIPNKYFPGGTSKSLLDDFMYGVSGVFNDPRTLGLLSSGNAASAAMEGRKPNE
jgi:hypothetical protein